MLDRAGLAETALGHQWRAAGARALRSAVRVPTPFRETGYFPKGEPAAAGYQLELSRGRRLSVDVSFETVGGGRLFVDLFEATPPDLFRPVASLEEGTSLLTYDVGRTGTFVLRVQPELLQSGRFTLVERTLASLPFPVPGVSAAAVQSLFGAPRDDGAREHEGVDIFAPRGAEIVAVTSGMARADTNALGGNVVWLWTGLGRRRYYYAHLDRWTFDGTARVEAGEVLGYIGNSGNARTTRPHLHFGIYEGGALDPLPFLRPDDPPPSDAGDLALLGALVRVTRPRAPLRIAPAAAASQTQLLERDSVGRVLGVSGEWRRIRLPDGSSGFVAARSIASARAPIRRTTLKAAAALHESPAAGVPVVAHIEAGEAVDVLGQFAGFVLLRSADGGNEGWAPRPAFASAAD